MAEKEGFEPSVPFLTVHTISSRAPSASSVISPHEKNLTTKINREITKETKNTKERFKIFRVLHKFRVFVVQRNRNTKSRKKRKTRKKNTKSRKKRKTRKKDLKFFVSFTNFVFSWFKNRWRRGWDLNPRSRFRQDTAFRERRLQPLGHLSKFI